MARQQPAEPIDATPENPLRPLDLSHGPLRLGDQLPAACGRVEIMRAFDLSRASFYRSLKLGAFNRFLLERPINPRKPWSGALIQRHLAGHFESSAFGQKARRASLSA